MRQVKRSLGGRGAIEARAQLFGCAPRGQRNAQQAKRAGGEKDAGDLCW
jgi:hypothetical protein